MERYYFDINDGARRTRDSEGLELPTAAAARALAMRELTDIMRDELPDGDREVFMVTVRNAKGIPIYFATAVMLGEMLMDD